MEAEPLYPEVAACLRVGFAWSIYVLEWGRGEEMKEEGLAVVQAYFVCLFVCFLC